ncbi:MAG: redox-regulated molecular chaperone Hsp33 [Fusobacteriales bacterium]|nr:MAG: redox-regulated molecular chaperone Hsp33 [Fusobacteriales bacterium]
MARIIRGMSKNARFFITDTTDIMQKALELHKYDRYSMEIFGKLSTFAVLMGATLKGKDKLTIRTDTEGFIKNIIVNSNAGGDIKGYLTNDNTNLETLGKGSIRIIKDMGLKEPYVAVSNIDYTTMANDISYYFYKSEQVPTVISFATEFTDDSNEGNNKILCAGGYMIQLLPNAEEDFIVKLEKKIQAIRTMGELMKGGMSLEKIINLLYDDMETEKDNLIEEYEILEEKEVRYHCDCKREKFLQGLFTLGEKELKKIFEEQEEIETECQFCNKKYKYRKKDLLKTS